MKFFCGAIVIALTVLTGCGVGIPGTTPDNNAANSSALPTEVSVADVRSMTPPDLDGDGRVDGIVHPALKRLLVQAPQNTIFQITRDGAELDFVATPRTLNDGTILHELLLENGPVGEGDIVLRAGDYALSFTPSATLAEPRPLLAHPLTPGALANDLAQPVGVLFPSGDDAALILSGGIPSLDDGLVLRSGMTREIPLTLRIHTNGIHAVPASALESRVVYQIYAGADATDPYGAPANTNFRLATRGASGSYPLKLLTADLNRDGDDELVTMFADGNITALTNVVGGRERVLSTSGEIGVDLASGDFDGNGALDLAVLLQSDDAYRILYLYNMTRQGDASFMMQSQWLELESPIALAAADFNRDGRADVAILDAFGAVSLRYGNGQSERLGGLPDRALCVSICAPDTNADGKPDLFVLGADGIGQVSLNSINGFGEGAAKRTVNVPGATRVICQHLDADNDEDFVFTGAEDQISVVLESPDAPASFAVRSPTGKRFAGVALARDLNRDSRTDILLALEDADGICDELALYLNGSDNAGTPDEIYPIGARVNVHAMEFWRDDVLLATSAGLLILPFNPAMTPPTIDSDVRFLEGFTPVQRIPAPLAAAVADFNDDGRSDLAALDKDGNLSVWLSGPEGEPFELSTDPIPLGVDGILKAIDFDRDSAPDLLYIPSDPVARPRLLRNNRRGEFGDDEGLLPTPPSELRGAPAMGDFDRDGDLDVLWPSPLGTLQMNLDSRWDGGTTLPAIRHEAVRLNFSGELTCADFTGDGIDDVVAVMEISPDDPHSQFLVLLEGRGSVDDPYDSFSPVVTTRLQGRFFGLSPADFNGDGQLDLAVGYGTQTHPARLTLLQLGAGKQFETFEGSPEPKGTLFDLALDDLDRDGDLDLIASEDIEDSGAQMTLWVNDGRGQFGQAMDSQRSLIRAVGGFRATNLSLSDFTGDGRPDLMAIDQDGNVVIVRTTLP